MKRANRKLKRNKLFKQDRDQSIEIAVWADSASLLVDIFPLISTIFFSKIAFATSVILVVIKRLDERMSYSTYSKKYIAFENSLPYSKLKT